MEAPAYIIATDNGLLHRIRQLAPGKTVLEAPTAGQSATCKSCAHCPWMAMNSLQGVINSLERHRGEIHVDADTSAKALGCIERMLGFVQAHPGAIAKTGLVRHLGAA
jgi:quinolinate synthase